MTSAYRKGYQFERQVFHLFMSAGYYVLRSAGSHGIFDLIAIKHSIPFGIQCKYNNNISDIEKQSMIQAYYQFGIIPLYVYRFKRKPLCILCLLDNKMISPEDIPKLPEMYKQYVLNHIFRENYD